MFNCLNKKKRNTCGCAVISKLAPTINYYDQEVDYFTNSEMSYSNLLMIAIFY